MTSHGSKSAVTGSSWSRHPSPTPRPRCARRTRRPLLGLRDDGVLHRPRARPVRDRRHGGRSPTWSIGAGVTCPPRPDAWRSGRIPPRPDRNRHAHPRFSWIVDHAQHAYELGGDGGRSSAVGDRGRRQRRVVSRRVRGRGPLPRTPPTPGVCAAGRMRASRSLWADSTFETALLDAADWVALLGRADQQDAARRALEHRRLDPRRRPRGRPGRGAAAPGAAPAPALRRAGRARRRARLYATARGVYSALVNGARVDDQVLAPGSDSYRHRHLGAVLRRHGARSRRVRTCSRVALADGWWAGRIGITGSSAQFGDTTSAIWQLHLDYADGTSTGSCRPERDVVSATGPWALRRPLRRRAVRPACCSRRTGTEPGFDDATGLPVRGRSPSAPSSVPFTGEPVRRVLELPAARVAGRPPRAAIVDFGQVIAGACGYASATRAPGQRIVDRAHRDARGRRLVVRQHRRHQQRADRRVRRGGRRRRRGSRRSPSTASGTRAIAGSPTRLAADDVVAVVLASDLEQTGSFTSSDARLDRLHQNVVWSQRGNFLSIPTDCPQRERAGWTGDIQVFAPAATNNAQVVPFLARWLDNLRADQLPDGRIPIFSPRSPFDAEAAATAPGHRRDRRRRGLERRHRDRAVDAVRALRRPCGCSRRTIDAMLRWIDYQRDGGRRAAASRRRLLARTPQRRKRCSTTRATTSATG